MLRLDRKNQKKPLSLKFRSVFLLFTIVPTDKTFLYKKLLDLGMISATVFVRRNLFYLMSNMVLETLDVRGNEGSSHFFLCGMLHYISSLLLLLSWDWRRKPICHLSKDLAVKLERFQLPHKVNTIFRVLVKYDKAMIYFKG